MPLKILPFPAAKADSSSSGMEESMEMLLSKVKNFLSTSLTVGQSKLERSCLKVFYLEKSNIE
jgi:hypothetical protein